MESTKLVGPLGARFPQVDKKTEDIRSRALLEKLTHPPLVKKLNAFYVFWMSFTVSTRGHQFSLS
jgi:hypothetical protein